MEALVGFVLLMMLWLTLLTRSNRTQRHQNKILQKRNKHYVRVIRNLRYKIDRYGQENPKESEAQKGEKADNAGE